MQTNGSSFFHNFQVFTEAEVFCAPEDIFFIAADTQEELLKKVFIDPDAGETEYIYGESPNHPGQGRLRKEYLAQPKNNLQNLKVTGEEDWVEILTAKPKRARDASGKFIPDDPSTPDYNEAWEGGITP